MEGWKVECFVKLRDENQSFGNLEAKNELLWKIRNEIDILPKRKKDKR